MTTATCHCGAVALDFTAPEPWRMTRCDCSMCRRKGAIMLAVPVDQLTVLKGAENLSLYQFNTNTAKHYFCKTCGIYTHHQRRSNPNEYGVNAGCIEGVNPRDLEPVAWGDGVNHSSDIESE